MMMLVNRRNKIHPTLNQNLLCTIDPIDMVRYRSGLHSTIFFLFVVVLVVVEYLSVRNDFNLFNKPLFFVSLRRRFLMKIVVLMILLIRIIINTYSTK